MCIHISMCRDCGNEVSRVMRDGQNDEPHKKWEAPVINGECSCPETFYFIEDGHEGYCESCYEKRTEMVVIP